ncbi:MAG: hypothetical protein CVV49_15955 [Spirochaetae bacterium HGW-Spirochaetae-5]|nr:MAG: hypothetical protein CVV49_15955 [Spirochaetae bacterium HGW-Spirochaetae-5]
MTFQKLKKIVSVSAAFMVILLSYNSDLSAQNRVAVVKSRFDNIELVLDTYHIKYDLLEFKELSSSEVFSRYDSIFFPSGILSEYEDNLDINWQGKDFTSVKLSKDFFELDEKSFKSNFRKFTKNGGSSYFSGYAYKQLALAYDDFNFFDDFPYMGIPGRIEADIQGDLARFSLKRKTALYMEYTGWIALKSVSGAEVLAEAQFSTPRGDKSGPISVIIHDGGEILYTSYYSSVYSEFKRFNIYRIAGSHLRDKAIDRVKARSQEPTGIIVDSFLGGETHRTYYFNLKEGNNTIHFLSDNAKYMFEIYDRNMSLIVTRDFQETAQSYNIISIKEDYCFVKVYPSGRDRFIMHSVTSAYGAVIPPGVTYTVKIILAVLGSVLLAAFLKVTISRLK